MSQTASCRVQADGLFRGWTSVVGAPQAWQAVDDSDGTSHDSDATHIVVPSGGLVSFPVFRGSSGWIPRSFVIRAAARTLSGSADLLFAIAQEGIADATSIGTNFNDIAGSYTLITSVIVSISPWTGLPFTSEELARTEIGFAHEGDTGDILACTLINATLTYDIRTNARHHSAERDIALTG